MTITGNHVSPAVEEPDLDQRSGIERCHMGRAGLPPAAERAGERAPYSAPSPSASIALADSRRSARRCPPDGRAGGGDEVRGFVALAGGARASFVADCDGAATGDWPTAFHPDAPAAPSVPVTVSGNRHDEAVTVRHAKRAGSSCRSVWRARPGVHRQADVSSVRMCSRVTVWSCEPRACSWTAATR